MKVLHIVAGLDTGGVAMLLYQYLFHLQGKDLTFDFIIHEDRKLQGRRGRFEEKFEALGSKIFKVVAKKESLSKNLKQVYAVMKNGGYDAVHIHNEETSALYSALAVFCNIKTRIVHAHYAYKSAGMLKKAYNAAMRFLIRLTATNWLACSRDAGVALFGEKAVLCDKFSVLHNAIEIDDFVYSDQKRIAVREKLDVAEGTFFVINIGRLTYQKNPEKTVEIFREICKMNDDSLLLMVGIGELEGNVRDILREYNLEKKVRLLGMRDDVNDLLQAADAFLLPSRFEGLGIVYVEAQAAGLHTYATEGKVPKEAGVCDRMHFCKEEAAPEEWAHEILRHAAKETTRVSPVGELKRCGYDIKMEAEKLLELYAK